jgi:membrane-associated protein
MEKLIPFIEAAGYIGVFGMIFAESGLLFGFIFPGDTLLFAAGILAAKGFFNITILLLGACFFAVVGDSVGYWIGKKIGPALFKRKDSLFFKQEYVARAQHFFDNHGKKTIFLSRYVPIVRTFAPVVAGVGGMQYKTFFLWNVLGGITWCLSIGLAGYFLGTKITNIDAYILPIVIGIFVVSFLPVVYQVLSGKKKSV